jgi:hypothetical protein
MRIQLSCLFALVVTILLCLSYCNNTAAQYVDPIQVSKSSKFQIGIQIFLC